MTNVFRLLKKQYDKAVAAIRKVIGNYSLGNMILFWLFQYFTFTLLQEGAVLYAGYRVLVSGTMVFAQMAVIQTTMNSNTWTLIGFADSVMAIVKNGLYLEQTRHFCSMSLRSRKIRKGFCRNCRYAAWNLSMCLLDIKRGTGFSGTFILKSRAVRAWRWRGYNGAGKSTLMKLLMRLYDPSEGGYW